MKIILKGHEYRYAVEQMLMTIFPQERPEYGGNTQADDVMEVSLSEGKEKVTAFCVLHIGGESTRGRASACVTELVNDLERDRVCQRLIKKAIYRAGLRSGAEKPVWGALTGVRPGKILHALISSGMDEKSALDFFAAEYDVSRPRAELCLDTTKATISAEKSLTERDICLYVGIPFCPTRCAYCSFVSQSVEKSMKLIDPFMDALKQEVTATGRVIRSLGLRVVSIYMGGGTPTTLSASQLDDLCTWLETEFDLSALREYTVEAGRPDTITEEKLRTLRAHGVDRISVNPQTMSDSVLEVIGRRHTAKDITDALEIAHRVGGFAVNMDIIAGLPTDTVECFADTMERVIALKPENITVHTLSLKKGSRITLNDEPLPTAEEVGRMIDLAGEKLRGAGYAPYYLYRQKFMSGGFENTGWCMNGRENLYNIIIMEEIGSIIAMGGGGSTKLVSPGTGRNIRIVEPKYPLEYISGIEKTCGDKQKIADFYNEMED